MENNEPNPFLAGNNDKNEEVAQFGRKYQITEQVIELPLENQVFDMIIAEGSAGLTLKEVCTIILPDVYSLFDNICSTFIIKKKKVMLCLNCCYLAIRRYSYNRFCHSVCFCSLLSVSIY